MVKKTLRLPNGLRVIIDRNNLYVTEKGTKRHLSFTTGKGGWIDYHLTDQGTGFRDRIDHTDMKKVEEAYDRLWGPDGEALKLFLEEWDPTDPVKADVVVMPIPKIAAQFVEAKQGKFTLDENAWDEAVVRSVLLKDMATKGLSSGLAVRDNRILGTLMRIDAKLLFQSVENGKRYRRRIAELVGWDPNLAD